MPTLTETNVPTRWSERVTAYLLERDVAVLALRTGDALGEQRLERRDDLRARLVGDDHVVDVAAFGGRVRVREARLVVVHQLRAALLRGRGARDVAAVDDVDRAL